MKARDFALLQLDGKWLPNWKAHALKTPRDTSEPADPRDRNLAEQIVIGVVKNLGLLQYQTAHWSARPLNKLDPLVQKILAIALYQLQFLDRVPQSAAVNEAVEQAKRFGRKSAAGFVNAVLRNAIRIPPPMLPDAATDPANFAEVALSHPREMFNRLQQLLGTDNALEICRHDNREPPTLVRVFDGIDITSLQTEGVELLPHEKPGIFVVHPARKPTLADWARRGLAQVQDATSAGVAEHLDVQPGQRVLDRCCGFGTKTLQMQQRAGDGTVFAIDPSAMRCQGLRQLLAKRGIQNVAVIQCALLSQSAKLLPASFDRVLVDVPCSNSGVLARRPEARYAQHPENLASLNALQKEILDDTAAWLSLNGLMVYSTCSIWPEENEQQIKDFLQRHRDYELLKDQTTLPSSNPSPASYHDGGYFALLRRRPS